MVATIIISISILALVGWFCVCVRAASVDHIENTKWTAHVIYNRAENAARVNTWVATESTMDAIDKYAKQSRGDLFWGWFVPGMFWGCLASCAVLGAYFVGFGLAFERVNPFAMGLCMLMLFGGPALITASGTIQNMLDINDNKRVERFAYSMHGTHAFTD